MAGMFLHGVFQKRFIRSMLLGAAIHDAFLWASKIGALKACVVPIVVVHRINVVAYGATKVTTKGNWHFCFRIQKKLHVTSLSGWCR